MSSKTVAIVQSSHIPWRGFFDLISKVDEFILFDDMQFTKRDWRNRNQIKTPSGMHWLSIPVHTKGRYLQKICDTVIQQPGWAGDHWKAIKLNYSRSPFFRDYCERIEGIYQKAGKIAKLSDVNYLFLSEICEILGLPTRLTWSMDYEMVEGKTERLAGLCRSAGASTYISGPSARHYIQPNVFANLGITLKFIDYSRYSPYPQPFGDFQGAVTILDSIFNQGADATRASLVAPLVD